MTKKKSVRTQKILEALTVYPEFTLRSLEWLVEHMDEAMGAAARIPSLSPEDFRIRAWRARAGEDYAYFALLLLARLLEEGSE